MIGLELSSGLSQTGAIRGFRRAIYSDLTTIELARVIEMDWATSSRLYGIWHVASAAINKYDL
jgi:dTDP-4-dehydrorhamnose reductase